MKTEVSMSPSTEDVGLRHLLPLVKQAGYNGMEPVSGGSGYLNWNTSEQEILEVKRMVRDTGLEMPNVGVWSLWENNLVLNDPLIQQKAEDIIKRQIEYAALMEADTILVIFGYVGYDFASKSKRIRYDVAYERCVKAFRSLVPLAERAGVSTGIESMWNRPLLSPLEMKRLVRDMGSPVTGAYFDVDNVVHVGYPEDWIGTPGSLIRGIRLFDYRTGQAGLGAFTDLFAGDMDFTKVIEAPKVVGYNDYLTLETSPNHRQFPEISIVSDKIVVDRICGMMG